MPTRACRVIVLAVVVLLSGACGGSHRTAGNPRPRELSAYERVLAQVRADGTVDKETALAAFSLAIARLPGVPALAGPRADIQSGTAAVDWTLAHWAELDPAQQRAVTAGLMGSGPGPAAYHEPGYAPRPSPSPSAADPNLPCLTADSGAAQPYRAALDAAISDIAGHLGRQLHLTVRLSVNTKPLVTTDTGKPATMYTYGCRGQAQSAQGQAPTGCTIHINPATVNGQYTDADLRAFLTHEAMHCFVLDKFGAQSHRLPSWMQEGIPLWVQAAIRGGDPKVTEWWQHYLVLDGTSLFKRTYDAIGFYAQLANSGVDVWHRIDAMISAFLAGGNAAAWQAATPGDAFLRSWAAGYARGARPGKDWDITGFGIPADRPVVQHFDNLTNSTSAAAKVPVAGVDLIHLDLRGDVVSVTGDPNTRGLLGLSDGDHPLTGLIGADLCTRSGGCSCPAGTPGAGATLPNVASGPGFLAVTGGPAATNVKVVVSSLDDYCAKPRTNCLVGTWTSVGYSLTTTVAGSTITETGGAGVVLRIGADGRSSVDFRPMRPITFTSDGTSSLGPLKGTIRFDGTAGGTVQLPPPGVSSGQLQSTGGSNFGTVYVTAAVTSPIKATVYNHVSLAGLANAFSQGVSVDTQPVLGANGFTCTDTTLTLSPRPGVDVQGAWTLSRTG